MKKIKIAFFGSDQYSEIVLNRLKKAEQIEIVNTNCPVGILASYGKIVPQETLDRFPFGILNLHPSLLPQYRGPAPVQTALLDDKTKTGITIMKMDDKIDHGPIVWQKKITIKPEETTGQLYERLFELGSLALIELLPDFLNGKIKLKPQDHTKATYTEKLSRESGFITVKDLFNKPSDTIRKLRAFTPWPGVWTLVSINNDQKRLKILKAHLEKDKLVIDQVQLEGKGQVTLKQLLEGYGPILPRA